MDQKITYNAVSLLPIPSHSSQQLRAVDILIAKNGVFRTNERWVYDALDNLIRSEHIKVDGNVITIGDNFESLLISLASSDPGYASMLVNYRIMITAMESKYDISERKIMSDVDSIMSTDEKIIYLASVLAGTVEKVDSLIDRLNSLESLCAEINLSLSVVESITLDENTNS